MRDDRLKALPIGAVVHIANLANGPAGATPTV
jgi:hypothetical protein